MPFSIRKKDGHYVWRKNGKLRLPQAPPAFSKTPGLKIHVEDAGASCSPAQATKAIRMIFIQQVP